MGNKLHSELYKELKELIHKYKCLVNNSIIIREQLRYIDIHYEFHTLPGLLKELKDTRELINYYQDNIKMLKLRINSCQSNFDKSKSK